MFVYDYEKKGSLKDFSKVYLMSKSPRRMELLDFLNPIARSIEIDERSIEKKYMEKYREEDFLTRAAKTCCEIAKAKSDLDLEDGALYISSDTMVVMDKQIYNKPKDKEEARKMLYSYFGKNHHVITSVCLRQKDYLDVFYSVATVGFVDYYPRLKEDIEAYVESGKAMDKAGAYGIQELDPKFISYIKGDINTIIGLPLAETASRIYRKGTQRL